MAKQHILNQGDLKKYFHIIPNIADEGDLTPEEYRLLGHYIRRGECYEGIRTTAHLCRMNKNTITSVRQSLVEKGWIEVRERPDGGLTITVLDRWAENMSYYEALSQTRAQAVPFEGTGGVPNEGTKEEPLEEEPIKQRNGAGAPPFKPLSTLEQKLADLCGLVTPALIDKRRTHVGRVIGLVASGTDSTGDVLDLLDGYGQWWYRHDFRGRKGEIPTLPLVEATWAQFLAWRAKQQPVGPRPLTAEEEATAQMVREQKGRS